MSVDDDSIVECGEVRARFECSTCGVTPAKIGEPVDGRTPLSCAKCGALSERSLEEIRAEMREMGVTTIRDALKSALLASFKP